MKKVLLLVTMLGLGFGLYSADVKAESPGANPGAVAGKVFDTAGNPVGGATVVLRNANGVVDRTTTDRAGSYGFRKVRPGKYVVRGAKRGVGTDSKRIRVRRGQTTRARLVLQ